MGFLLEDRQLFSYSANPKFPEKIDMRLITISMTAKETLPLYICQIMGFCGSFTSFGIFITDGFLALSNLQALPSPVSPYHDMNPSSM